MTLSEAKRKILGSLPALSPSAFQDQPFSSRFFKEQRKAEKPGKHYAPLTKIKEKHTVSISHKHYSQNQNLILFSDMWESFLLDTQPSTAGRKQDIL